MNNECRPLDIENKMLKRGDLSDRVLNPLTTIKGYLDLKSKDLIGQEHFDKQVIRLLLEEVELIEKYINEIEQTIESKVIEAVEAEE
ncbi:hypothetical protein SAMN00017405_1183 [Desulfonispora thiosulfatigenes DSM 11270]|uniref:Histidine kinase n=1 Tax=Desulfonispora thiosulfatigenes DSM 11270 TaxID=656914 RepID=A0A1W1V054_DESTI|nr:hypothetical protein [Desulfonispora thiosulfatigenes]SMB86735.1 hypothetical protein SAMN00017405_1183 [Desulfonispora thiosulfatigenes DSM 11270]